MGYVHALRFLEGFRVVLEEDGGLVVGGCEVEGDEVGGSEGEEDIFEWGNGGMLRCLMVLRIRIVTLHWSLELGTFAKRVMSPRNAKGFGSR